MDEKANCVFGLCFYNFFLIFVPTDENMKDDLAGSTAICALIKNGTIYTGNVGDSRAICSVKGEVQQLSFDHKPSNELETKRIISAGGWVEFNRVNGT